MNAVIKKLMLEAGYAAPEIAERAQQLALLIVKECIYTLQLKIVRNGNTPENLRSRNHILDLGEKFGIIFPMDYERPDLSQSATSSNSLQR